MALSFAPLALIYPEIKIIDPDVIRKSYPEYWNELKNMGFTIVEG
jgi:3-phosphoshikimate 1-carboxyvinyltransferase